MDPMFDTSDTEKKVSFLDRYENLKKKSSETLRNRGKTVHPKSQLPKPSVELRRCTQNIGTNYCETCQLCSQCYSETFCDKCGFPYRNGITFFNMLILKHFSLGFLNFIKNLFSIISVGIVMLSIFYLFSWCLN